MTRRSLTRRFWCDEKLPADIVDAILDGEIERLLYSSSPLQVKSRCIAVRHDHPTGPLLIKRHTWGGLSRTLRSVGREASAASCGRLGLVLSSLGIPTPMPRACLEQRIGPWGIRSYLITDYVEGTSLYRHIRFGKHSAEELRHLARQVACIWQQMVEAGISHNDMKPENFIVDEQHRVWIIDLEKVRLHEKSERQQRRCALDVKNFLHVRGWHHRAEAREIFLSEFQNTPYGSLLDRLITLDDQDPELSVLIWLDQERSLQSIRQAIDSVRDIADEAVLLTADETGQPQVVDRIALCGAETDNRNTVRADVRIARHPWVLFLRQNEIVTPFLAKELQQRIVERDAGDAIRITIDTQLFGDSVARSKDDASQPFRLITQDHCDYSVANGEFMVVTDTVRASRLTGLIECSECATVAELVEQLNEQTTCAAQRRWRNGERPRLISAMLRAVGRTTRLTANRHGIGSGVVGLQIALLRGFFTCVEEFKLRQLSREFFIATSDASANESDERPTLMKRAA